MNNNPRFYLWLALAVVLWLNYTTWQRDFPPLPAAATAVQSQTAPSKQPSALANSIPQAQQSTASDGVPPAAAAPASPPPPARGCGGYSCREAFGIRQRTAHSRPYGRV